MDGIAVFLEIVPGGPEHFAGRVQHHIGVAGLQEIDKYMSGRLAGAAAADHHGVKVSPVPVHALLGAANGNVLGHYQVGIGILTVPVLPVNDTGTAPLGAAIFFSAPEVHARGHKEQHCQPIEEQAHQHTARGVRHKLKPERVCHSPVESGKHPRQPAVYSRR